MAVHTLTPGEAEEVRRLLSTRSSGRRAAQLMSRARLRRLGLSNLADASAPPQFDELVANGTIVVDPSIVKARITPHPSPNQIFRVAVGVTHHPVDPGWNSFDQRYQWFGKEPKQVTSGAHLFVLAVDRWKSAVVGLYEAVSAGAVKLDGSPDPNRWPYALGVRPLAAVPPPEAVRVPGQRGPQSGLPEHVHDHDAQRQLYAAVAASPPPPGPRTLEQQVQEVEPVDVEPDVLEAVRELGRSARKPAVIARALEMGEWDSNELAARAWYTSKSGATSHVENITAKALQFAEGKRLETADGTRMLRQIHGVYSIVDV